jgi:hypothetical protein
MNGSIKQNPWEADSSSASQGILAFCENRIFITVFKTAHHSFLSLVKTYYFSNTHFNNILTAVPRFFLF